jgi:hypothetical protein
MPRRDIDGTILGSWERQWPEPVRKGRLPGPSPNITKPFWELYDTVTDMIRERYQSPHPGVVSGVFLEYLIAGFFAAYQEWPKNPKLLNYLVLFNRKSPFRVLQLLGQAYLHMAYDLPRTIADAISAHPAVPVAPAVAKLSYLSLEPGFVKASEESLRRLSQSGIFAIIGFLSFSRGPAAGTFTYWVKAIRAVAFHHAEILASPPPPYTRAALEKRLFRGVNRAAISVLRHSWNPLLWIPGLASPVLVVLAVPLIGISAHAALRIGEVLIAAILFYFFLAYRGLIELTEELGAAIHAAAWEAVGSLRPREEIDEAGERG